MLELLMPIKDRIRELRTAAGLTQQGLAFQAGISDSAVVQLEAGRIPNPRVNTLRALAAALGVTVDAFLTDGPEEPPADEPEKPPRRKGRKSKGGS
jgi:transcriptional regulator with XRE-family HTH domain